MEISEGSIENDSKTTYVERNLVARYEISAKPIIVISFFKSCLIFCLFLVPSKLVYLNLLSIK
jgi:hypothetical protein